MFSVGLDLGQRQDHSAITVVERRNMYRAHQNPVFHDVLVRHVERVPLGTPYPKVVERVREIVRQTDQCALVVDATGVGMPVVDMLRSARLGCDLVPVTITGGDKASRNGGMWSVPKRDLIAEVQVLLERGALRIARRLKDAGSLTRELMEVRMTMSGKGRVRMGADGSGEHDDLVIALALAVWRAKWKPIGFGGPRLPGI